MITVKEYADEHIEAVRQFNDRLRAGGLTARFPLSPVPAWLPKIAGRRLFQEYYLAIDEDNAVRGAYILKHQDFWLKRQLLPVGTFQLPVSEGVVNHRYPQVGVQLLRDAMARQPLLLGLGMGGYHEAVTQLLRAAGWSMFTVPFFFRIVRPVAFLRNVAYLRRRAAMRWSLDVLAMTGLGWLGVHAVQALHRRQSHLDSAIAVEPVNDFSAWADDLWEACKDQYGMSAVRNAETLRVLYPATDSRFIRLKVTEQSRPIGWAVLLNSPLVNHKYFGNMRLGSIVGCLAATTDTAKVVGAARMHLESHGADLIVSNHSHAAWCRGFQQAGFLRGPSNFIFAASKPLTELLQREGVHNDDLHFNRGDGDGPINL
jgi:hypothetical protein